MPFLDELNDVNEILLGRPLTLTRYAWQQNGRLRVRIDDVELEGPEGLYSEGELGPSATWLWASQTPSRIEVFRVQGDELEFIGDLEASFAPGQRVQWASRTVLHYLDGSGDWAAVDVRRLRPRPAPASAPEEPAISVIEGVGFFFVSDSDGRISGRVRSVTSDGPLLDPRLARSEDGICAQLLTAGMSPVAIRCVPLEPIDTDRGSILE